MLQNAYFLAKIGADTAENEQHFAENLPKILPKNAARDIAGLAAVLVTARRRPRRGPLRRRRVHLELALKPYVLPAEK